MQVLLPLDSWAGLNWLLAVASYFQTWEMYQSSHLIRQVNERFPRMLKYMIMAIFRYFSVVINILPIKIQSNITKCSLKHYNRTESLLWKSVRVISLKELDCITL